MLSPIASPASPDLPPPGLSYHGSPRSRHLDSPSSSASSSSSSDCDKDDCTLSDYGDISLTNIYFLPSAPSGLSPPRPVGIQSPKPRHIRDISDMEAILAKASIPSKVQGRASLPEATEPLPRTTMPIQLPSVSLAIPKPKSKPLRGSARLPRRLPIPRWDLMESELGEQ